MISQSMENYLKVIFEILEHEERANTSAIAGVLGVAPASVTAMLKKLADMKMIAYEPYQGVRLTEVGEKTALEVLRHHRLLELYLAEALDVPWDRVHEEAERLEHVLSEDLEERISAVLGNPTVDPHGSPIPSRDGIIERPAGRRLSAVPAGETVKVIEVGDRDPDLLRYLGKLEMYPGTEVKILAIEPFQGPMVLSSKGREFILGRQAADKIQVSNGS